MKDKNPNSNNNTKKRFTERDRNTNNKTNIQKEEILNKTKEIMAYKGQELNDLTYELTLKYDKIAIIHKKAILFSFCYTNDYNARSIKIDLFFIGLFL